MAFSATDAAFEGFRLTKEKPLTVLVGWTLAYVLFFAVICGVIYVTFGPAFLDKLNAIESAEPSTPQEAFELMAPLLGALGLLFPIGLISGAMLYAAVFRAVLRPQDGGLFYFKLGGDELRILAVNVVLAILFMTGIVVGAVVLGVASGAAGAANQGVGGLIGVVGGLALVCAIIFVAVRLSLALPMTFAEKRIRIFESWSLTKGRFWGLLGMFVLAVVFAIIVSILGSVIASAVLAAMGGGMGALTMASAPDLQALSNPQLLTAFAVYILITLVFSALQLAIMYAPAAAAYRALKGEQAGA